MTNLKPIDHEDTEPLYYNWNYWKKGCGNRVVVASDGQQSIILNWIGPDLEFLFSEITSPENCVEFDGIDPGVWLITVSQYDTSGWIGDYYDYNSEFVIDKIEKLSKEDFEIVKAGEGPWDDSDFIHEKHLIDYRKKAYGPAL